MDRNYIDHFIQHYLDTQIINEYSFKEICGFYFVFRTTIRIIHEKTISSEINPMGIIYMENNEYYYAPFLDEDRKEIIKKFVETYII